MIDRLEFLLGEAFTALRRNLLMTFAAISTAAVALFLLGSLAYVYSRVNSYATEVSTKFEMRAWMKVGTTENQAKLSLADIRKIQGVKQAVFVPKDIEWEKMKIRYPRLTKGWSSNVLPHSIKIIMDDVTDTIAVEDKVKKVQYVDPSNVVYLRDEQQLIERVMAVLRWAGGALGSLLLVTAGILIYNAIRLTILARRREIRIMQLVGASRSTIRIPFLIEGTVHGVLGGAFAAILIGIAQNGIERVISQIVFGQQFPPYPMGMMVLILSGVGGGFGLVCSYWAIREPLRYKSGVVL